jgi:hypothetical protein
VTTADAVRGVGLALPRTHEQLVGGRWKLKVRQLVYVAFSRDEQDMGFAFPREQRDDLVESAPDVFFLPRPGDLRYQWVCAHLDRLDDDEMRELVVDAWRMCVPRMLHDLPDLPAPAAQAWDRIERQDWPAVRELLHPDLHWTDGDVVLRGRRQVLGHLAVRPTPRPPAEVETRDDQIYRWTRA